MISAGKETYPTGSVHETISTMTAVLQMTRALEERPVARPNPGLTVRTFTGPQDIDLWLDLRHAAFAGQSVPAGPWTRQDFQN